MIDQITNESTMARRIRERLRRVDLHRHVLRRQHVEIGNGRRPQTGEPCPFHDVADRAVAQPELTEQMIHGRRMHHAVAVKARPLTCVADQRAVELGDVELLLGVIGTVLVGIAGIALFWIRRARALDGQGFSGDPQFTD